MKVLIHQPLVNSFGAVYIILEMALYNRLKRKVAVTMRNACAIPL